MSFLPCVVHAEYRGGFRVHLTFNDLTAGTLDFTRWLNGPIFEPVKNPEYFSKFYLDGGTLAWPNGADVAPETLYEAAIAAKKPRPSRQRKAAKSGAARPQVSARR